MMMMMMMTMLCLMLCVEMRGHECEDEDEDEWGISVLLRDMHRGHYDMWTDAMTCIHTLLHGGFFCCFTLPCFVFCLESNRIESNRAVPISISCPVTYSTCLASIYLLQFNCAVGPCTVLFFAMFSSLSWSRMLNLMQTNPTQLNLTNSSYSVLCDVFLR